MHHNRSHIVSKRACEPLERYRAVHLCDRGELEPADGSKPVYGVTADAGAELGEVTDVVIAGITQVECGEALSAGDTLIAGPGGVVCKGPTNKSFAIAETEGLTGSIIPALITR